MSIFNRMQNELTGGFYQTVPLSSIPHYIDRLIEVAAVIRVHYLNEPFWKLEFQKGSLTFRYHYHEKCSLREKGQHTVIKVFVDVGQKLARMERINYLFKPGYDPVAIGVELGHEDPYIRKGIRKLLKEDFKGYYLDPEANHYKYKLNPSEHYYDIVFLKEGPCPDYFLNQKVRSFIEEITDKHKKSIGGYSVHIWHI